MPTIECCCGYSCGTLAAFERHLARNLPGEHRNLGSLDDLYAAAAGAAAPAAAERAADALWQKGAGISKSVFSHREINGRLLLACEAGDLETVKEMLAAGANVDGNDRTIKQHPLTVAAQCNQRAVVETLLSRSASIIIVSNGRIGTLAKGVYEGRLRMASYLLAHITTQPFVRRIASSQLRRLAARMHAWRVHARGGRLFAEHTVDSFKDPHPRDARRRRPPPSD